MITLTETDLQFVARRIPKDIREIMKDHPVYLAGGFIRETIAGGKVQDVDLFGNSKDSLKAIAQVLALKRQVRAHETDNAITIVCPPRMPVQFITRWTFNQPENLVKSFDFTVCQCAIWIDKSTGLFTSMVSESFYPDLAARRLVYTFPSRDEEAGGSMMRVRKFLQRGYNIQALSLGGVIARLVAKVDRASLPIGRFGDAETAMAHVVGSLLVEVDPLLVIDGLEPINEHAAFEGEAT